jgi:hypothetical protein
MRVGQKRLCYPALGLIPRFSRLALWRLGFDKVVERGA